MESLPGSTIRLIEFCPGEGSTYVVGVARVSEADARPLGGTAAAVLVTFGGEHDLRSMLLEADPAVHRYLAFEKVLQRLAFSGLGDNIAAHHVIAALLSREALGSPAAPDRLDWSPDWRDQLQPLLDLMAELPAAAARERFGADLFARFDAVHAGAGG